MTKPDFFIVRAPKCGTTAMQDCLSQHPEIFMPEAKPPFYRGKELHFLGSELRANRKIFTRDEYFSYFPKAKDEKRVGEATVWYLCSKRAAYEIKEFNPSSKIIIMLRNPVEMVYSCHFNWFKMVMSLLKIFGRHSMQNQIESAGYLVRDSVQLQLNVFFIEKLHDITNKLRDILMSLVERMFTLLSSTTLKRYKSSL